MNYLTEEKINETVDEMFDIDKYSDEIINRYPEIAKRISDKMDSIFVKSFDKYAIQDISAISVAIELSAKILKDVLLELFAEQERTDCL